jgi:hypothetical protein
MELSKSLVSRMFVSSCLAVLVGIACNSPSVAAEGATPVVTKDLNGSRVPGKVAAVLWTVRADQCTLQVVFPNAGRIAQAVQNDPKLRPQRPHVQVWLLKADGSLIAPLRRLEPGVPAAGKRNPRQPYGVEVNFSFPLSADGEAIAAAIQVDDSFYVEPLKTVVKAVE